MKVQTYECLDRGARWDTTPCLCDCHYRGGPCGDVDRQVARMPRVERVTRRRRRPE